MFRSLFAIVQIPVVELFALFLYRFVRMTLQEASSMDAAQTIILRKIRLTTFDIHWVADVMFSILISCL